MPRSSLINSDTPLVDLEKFREGIAFIHSRVKKVLSGVGEKETAELDSPLARVARHLILFPLLLEKDALREPASSSFEQSLFLYLEGVVLFLMERVEVSEEEMLRRHANLE